MDATNLLQVRKDSWSTPLLVIIMSLISYYYVKEKGMTVILIVVLSLGIIFCTVSIIMFYLLDNSKKVFYLGSFFSLMALETGFINLWLMTINRPLLEITLLLIFMIAGCILGFCFLKKKVFFENTKQGKIRFGLISSCSCIGILLARFLVLFINQEALFSFVRILWEVVIFVISFFAGGVLLKSRTVPN